VSTGAFSQRVIQLIVQRAADSIRPLGTQITTVVEKGVARKTVRADSPLNLEQIRAETNPAASGYQTVVTRGGLLGLADSFTQYSNEAENYKLAGELLQQPQLYDNFKKFILNKYKDVYIKRTSTKQYAYETLQTTGGDVRIGTRRGTNNEEDLVIFKNLDHGKFKPLFLEFLKTNTGADQELITFIGENLDAGHLAGAFNIKLRRIFNLQVAGDPSGEKTYRDFRVSAGTDSELNETFNRILLLIHDADYVSSNIVYDIKLFTSAAKEIHRPKGRGGPRVAVELQLSKLNADAGRALSAIGRQLNNLIESVDASKSRIDVIAAKKAVEGVLKNLNSVVAVIEKTVERLNKLNISQEARSRLETILADAKTTQGLITARGSSSLVESVAEDIAAALTGKKLPEQQTRVTKTTKLTTKSGTGQKKRIPKVKKPAKRQVPQITKVRAVTMPQPSLTSLENLLRLQLQQTVRQNMGTGTRRDILNLRSGRFASSVKIDRLTQSREGTITAFYDYMRYPYATFSRGGDQERPFTRDPKLLIAGSIRQIAEQVTTQRLRAVLV
jgi:hypothetical protein